MKKFMLLALAAMLTTATVTTSYAQDKEKCNKECCKNVLTNARMNASQANALTKNVQKNAKTRKAAAKSRLNPTEHFRS